MPHCTRPQHAASRPVHVTMRAVGDVVSLREPPCVIALEGALARVSRDAFRLVHYSIQASHVHLIVEAHDREALLAGLRGLAIRTARAINRAHGRRGRVWADRYHARALGSPREVRIALVYVLQNHRPRGGQCRAPDPHSSGWYFDGWRDWRPPPRDGPSPVRAPRTWLAAEGWKRYGRISLKEAPAS